MKRLLSVMLAFLMFFGGLPAAMAETVQTATPVMVNGSGGMFYTSSGSVGGGMTVAGGPSSPVSGSAAPAISQEQALAIAEGIFPDIGSLNVDAQLVPYQSPARWMLSWSEPQDVAGPAITMNNIAIDATTGALDSFEISGLQGDKTGSPLITRDEALQKAEEFIKQYHPEELAHAVLSPDAEMPIFNSTKMVSFAYSFHWTRMEQGAPVPDDGIRVGVDPFGGRIESCSFDWHTGVTFPSPVAVDPTKESQLLDQFGVILCYQVQPGQLNAQGVPEVTPVYIFNCSPGLQIDPASGGALTSEGKPASLGDYVLIPGLTPAVSSIVYNDQPVAPPVQEITQDAAAQQAWSFFQALGLSGKAVFSGSSSGGSWDGISSDKTWEYTLQNGGSSQGMEPQPTVGIDAVTGEVENYFNPQGVSAPVTGNAKPALTTEEARDKALAFIKQVSPDKVGQIAAANQTDLDYDASDGQEVQEVPVYFPRLIDGIPFPQEGISVTFDQSGDVANYQCNWYQVAIAPVRKIITADQARQILLQNNPLKAGYSFPVSQTNSAAPAGPVFVLNYQGGGVAADTGQPEALDLGMLGMETGAAQQPEVTVPQDHWAVAPLTILADSGLLPAEGFNPDGVVARRDALRVLMGSLMFMPSTGQRSTNRSVFSDVALNDPDYDLIQSAVGRGVLDPGPSLNPDETITRATFVEWLVRAMGYRLVAEMPASIALNFSDVQQLSNTDRNYLAIADGLGIVKGDAGGMFHPDATLTWAELATMVTEAAPRLQTL